MHVGCAFFSQYFCFLRRETYRRHPCNESAPVFSLKGEVPICDEMLLNVPSEVVKEPKRL